MLMEMIQVLLAVAEMEILVVRGYKTRTLVKRNPRTLKIPGTPLPGKAKRH
jgi:hypothetical protein